MKLSGAITGDYSLQHCYYHCCQTRLTALYFASC